MVFPMLIFVGLVIHDDTAVAVDCFNPASTSFCEVISSVQLNELNVPSSNSNTVLSLFSIQVFGLLNTLPEKISIDMPFSKISE